MKARVLCRARPGTTLTFGLPEGEALIGREPGMAVSLVMDGVSRKHAKIAWDGKLYWLEDLGSTNGTFLNGRPARRERLRHLDVITLGKRVDLVFLLREDEVQPIRRQGIVRVELVNAADESERHEVPVGELTFGRSAACNVVLPTGVVSSLHARMQRTADQLVIDDMDSSNGTFVNGARVMTSELRDGDVISLAGAFSFRVEVELGDVVSTSSSGARARAQMMASGVRARQQFSPEWRTRFDWSSGEMEAFKAVREGRPDPMAPKPTSDTGPNPKAEPRTTDSKPVPAAKPAPAKPAAPAAKAPEVPSAPPAPKPPAAPAVAAAPAEKPAAGQPPLPPQPPLPLVEPPTEKTEIAKPAARAAEPAAPASEPALPGPPSEAATPAAQSTAAAVPPAASQAPPTEVVAAKPPAGEAPLRAVPPPLADPPPATPAAGQTKPQPVVRAGGLGPIEEIRLTGGGLELRVSAPGAHELGRARESALRVDHPTVSRRHARIVLAEDRAMAYVQDAGGSNGTYLDGLLIEKLAPLIDGAVIRVGDVDLRVSLVRR